jgi:two-component system NtrC family sensor kinase
MKKTSKISPEAEKFSRIRWIILSRTLLAPFVILMLVCSTLVYYFATNLYAQVESELVRVVDDHRSMIEQFLEERTEDLKFIADTNSFVSICRQNRLAEIVYMLQAVSPAFLDLGVFDNIGNHVAYQGPYNLEGRNYNDAEWFQAVEKRSVYISDIFLGYRNTPHFIIAVKKMENGKPWYLRATIDTFFFNNLVENIRVGKTGEAYLINKNGVFQTKKRSGGKLMEIDPDFSNYQQINGHILSYTGKDLTENKYRYAIGRLEQTGWLMVVRQDFMEASAPLIQAVLVAIGLIFAGGAVVVVIAFFMASGLAHRLTIADVEKREMGSQLIMAGKLAEVGEMSSGMAHEINNPLQVMMAEMTMISDLFSDLKTDEKNVQTIKMLKESMDQIGVQINRCKGITQGLLKFARKSEPMIRKIMLEELIVEVAGMIEHQAKLQDIEIKYDITTNISEIESDPAQLQQVFLNLLNNAMYAVKNEAHPEITITAKSEENYVAVCIADNGCGIAPDQLKKIFVPFFTTKPVGKGTGLGLSTCYGIIENLGGRIEVSSTLDAGTTFSVYLPKSGSPEKR